MVLYLRGTPLLTVRNSIFFQIVIKKTSAPSAVDAASRVHLRRLAALHREAMQGIQEAERALTLLLAYKARPVLALLARKNLTRASRLQ